MKILEKHKNGIGLMILLNFICPVTIFAQHETGTYTERDRGGGVTREVRDVGIINAEYNGRAPERPEVGGRGEGGGRGSSAISSERTAKVTINGESFKVSKDGEKRLVEFLNTYRNNGKVGGFVSAVASIFSLFDMFSLENSYTDVEAMIKLSSLDLDSDIKDAVTKLSAPSIWNRAWRAQAASYCESEFASALSKGKDNEAKMWLRIRDIIANPERYEDNGIKYNSQKNLLMFRSYPAEGYRSISGFDLSLTEMDIDQLGYLTNYLMFFPQSRDFVIYADYIYDLGKPKSKFKKITARDKMILNYALLGLNQNAKLYLKNAFSINSGHPHLTYRFWSTLEKFLYHDSWDNGMAIDSSIDELGFYTGESFSNSDLVTGQYPNTNIFNTALPATWKLPDADRFHIYQFYYLK